MTYSRRHFVKAAGTGIALTAIAGETAFAAVPSRVALPMTREKATFVINGKPLVAEYEARTTLWEVVAVQLGLTGTTRSCNRASCGACSVLVDGTPFYSCHTLATEASGKKIFTIEGLGDENNLHPLQKIGYMHMAADCGFCTAGWSVTAKALLDKNSNPTRDEVKKALAGHICRCSAYSGIIRTVVDAGKVLRNPLTKIEATPESVIQIKQPMVRNFSTGGGHLPGDTLVEGDGKIVTQKWQGYRPENLKVVGKSMPPMPEIAIPRYTGKAMYASRVLVPNLLYAKPLTSPHPHARIKSLDTSKAEGMPGVAYILTYKNAPSTYPLSQELHFQGDLVAIVAADTENLAEDAVAAIEVEYDILPFASTLQQVMSPDAPDLRPRRGKKNVMLLGASDPHHDPDATWVSKHGDVEKGFQEADVIKEFTYSFAGATAVPMQPVSSVAKWDGDKLTFWGMGQGIYPQRDEIARALRIDPKNIRYINKWNGCTFGSVMAASRIQPFIAHIAKMAGRPVKIMLNKDQEFSYISIKPETITKFKVGAKKDGRIVALVHEIHISAGAQESAAHATTEVAKNNQELYTADVPHWKSIWYCYKTNAMVTNPVRSYTQQEIKWAWENMIDEMAEVVGKDPLQFRLMHISKPGMKLSPAKDWHAQDLGQRYEIENGALTYDSFASVEVLEEGAKAIGWDKRNPVPGGAPGRVKRGIGLGMSQHHAGMLSYHEGEAGFEKAMQAGEGTQGLFGAELEVNASGNVIMKNALPDSGTNHDTALAQVVAEMLGFTTRDHIQVIWGDSDLAPSSNTWYAGRTITLQGAAVFSAADKLRKDLLQRATAALQVDAAKLEIKDGAIFSKEDPKARTTFAALAKANGGFLRQTGRGLPRNQGRAMTKGVGACFVEVEVDTWTGDWRVRRSVYCHDTGLVVNPLVAEADLHGSLVEATQMTTDPIPWDREFPGTKHYSVGYLSYRLPTIMDVPEDQTNILVDSLEPRWFYGTKSFSETSIGSVPGAISNAVYNATGVRIREHAITRDKILAGLKAKGAKI
jgi:CO/xanthine dehydrogenase Mo-binding subunit/aerobic-type carbon monoxide dehydrogenase small subunit (CoxS/CutS family)